MRPQNLKWPFSPNEKKLQILDGVWYVPLRNKEEEAAFVFPGWEAIFGNKNPVHLEYCSGNGAWIAHKAQSHPTINWVAIERKFDRVRKIWSKVKNLGLHNLFIICGEGFQITREFLPADGIAEIAINFPDPWPKKRHFKNRIIQAPFVQELGRILTPRGKLTLVTDDVPFSEWSLQVLMSDPNLRSLYPDPYFINTLEQYGTSYFEELWREKGKEIRYHQFQKESIL